MKPKILKDILKRGIPQHASSRERERHSQPERVLESPMDEMVRERPVISLGRSDHRCPAVPSTFLGIGGHLYFVILCIACRTYDVYCNLEMICTDDSIISVLRECEVEVIMSCENMNDVNCQHVNPNFLLRKLTWLPRWNVSLSTVKRILIGIESCTCRCSQASSLVTVNAY